MSDNEHGNIKIGQNFRHFKGTIYRIVRLTFGAAGDDLVPRVVYRKLDNGKLAGREYSRPVSNFLEEIDRQKPDDNAAYKGPRFMGPCIYVDAVLKALLDMNLEMEQLDPDQRKQALNALRDYWRDPAHCDLPAAGPEGRFASSKNS